MNDNTRTTKWFNKICIFKVKITYYYGNKDNLRVSARVVLKVAKLVSFATI